MNAIIGALSLLALIVAVAAARSRRRLQQALQTRALLHSADSGPPLPMSSHRAPLLDHPEQSEGWIFTTGDGTCTSISDGARALLGVDAKAASESTDVARLLRGGDTLLVEMLNDLQERSLAPGRCAQIAADPSRSVELAGVALRDRGGNLWGAALLIRPAPSQNARP